MQPHDLLMPTHKKPRQHILHNLIQMETQKNCTSESFSFRNECLKLSH